MDYPNAAFNKPRCDSSRCQCFVRLLLLIGVELKPDPPVVVPVKTKVQVSIPRRRPRPVVKLACNFSTPRKCCQKLERLIQILIIVFNTTSGILQCA